MRRRRFVASVLATLTTLAGCLGGDPGDGDRADGSPAEREWEPAPTESSGRNPENGATASASDVATAERGSDTGATETTAADEATGRSGGSGSGGPDEGSGKRGSDAGTGDDESAEAGNASSRDASAGGEAFDEGSTWEADRAQVAADARRAGAAVEFELETTPLEPCGRTCRELRAALTNAGTGDAHDVTVRTELRSAGTTLRERRNAIGSLPAGETYRATERVELDAIEAVRVRQNGPITVEHVVTSAERREVFRERIEPEA
jgi:hypothetical protein